MKVIAIIRRTIDGVARKPGDEPFDLDDDFAGELIEQGVVADANPKAPVAVAAADEVEHPVGYVGRHSGTVEEPVAASEPVSTEFPASAPAEVPEAPARGRRGAR